ncbi:MAG: PfaD family polyunsaturated fatty acid/polyketide biosynthesis protein [Anaerolineaceae bacterium]
MNSQEPLVRALHPGQTAGFGWANNGIPEPATADLLCAALLRLDRPFYLLRKNGEYFTAHEGAAGATSNNGFQMFGFCPELEPTDLGDPAFKTTYGTRYPLYAGSMANGISSEEMVIALGRAGLMGSFGAGGCLPTRVEKAIDRIRTELGDSPYLFNLINSPFEPALEARTAELYIQHGIRAIEASAYLTLTPNLVWYRLTGLSQGADGTVKINHRIIAKVSRKEVAQKFLQPADQNMVNQLLAEGKVTADQARLAQFVPMADDVTVEADSGGHTDNRPLVSILPAIIQLRDTLQEKYQFAQMTRIGAAGGIATPAAALAAFMMGAAYVTTGSVNQGCVESGASAHSKALLSQMETTDVAMAPASDMFEMGVKVQVLKRGTMFAMRGLKLYEIYQRYESIDEIPPAEREKLESTIFKQSLDSVWNECVKFFSERDPKQIERANKKPKDKMALIFRWYLGLSSRWASIGEKGREMDYQIWCGPSMGAFNDWARNTYLEKPENRQVVDVSMQLLQGAAYLWRIRTLEAQGIRFASQIANIKPSENMAK